MNPDTPLTDWPMLFPGTKTTEQVGLSQGTLLRTMVRPSQGKSMLNLFVQLEAERVRKEEKAALATGDRALIARVVQDHGEGLVPRSVAWLAQHDLALARRAQTATLEPPSEVRTRLRA